MLGKVGAIHDQHPILFSKRLIHQALVFGQQRVIIPPAFPNELLERSDLPFCMRSHSQQTESHRFDVRGVGTSAVSSPRK
jgi:hypothetical protein